MKKGNLFILTVFATALLMSVPVCATPTSDDLKRIERQLQEEREAHLESQRQSDKLSNEIRAVQKQMVRSAQAVQEKEDTLLRLESRLEELRKEEETLSQKLMQSKAQTVHLVTALQSLALKPKEQIFLEKQAPTQILRSRMMLNSAVPIAQRMTQDVLLDVEKLEETKVEIQSQIRKVKETMETLTSKTEQLNGLIAKKTKLQAEYDASHELSRKRIVALAGQANDLKELLQRLEKERQRQMEIERKKKQEQEEAEQKRARLTSFFPIGSSFEKAKGTLPYPVIGQIVENYGDTTMKGMHAKGMTILARSGAILRSPFKGTVLFSGPFKSYGKMLIIDCMDGYLLLLAGLDDMNAFTGQEVIAGEPVGRMGNERTKLYIEIRKDGQAIDPKPWFRR
ncbi:MAG: peptidoglycan DD-metalloendopeptidase family protein [Alphaproteobacteria bacterium]|nr:peptidoglycan DD-metalloendopeptidase family protein [Alphaproteobacteria bacterium]